MVSAGARSVLLFGACLALARGAGHDHLPITYSGYIVDYECLHRTLAGMGAPDMSNALSGLADHKAACLLLNNSDVALCLHNGYYMAQSCGGTDNYHPKFDLFQDPVTHANAVAYLESISPADTADIKVTVEGINDHGKIINGTFSACTGSDCDGVCNETAANCAGLDEEKCSDNTVTYSGYIIDWYCHDTRHANGELAPDGSNITAAPWDHYIGCLLLENDAHSCMSSGYYLAEKTMDNSYHPKFDLRGTEAQAIVVQFLEELKASNSSAADITVTVSGTNNNGVLEDITITRCTYRGAGGSGERGCDGICTGKCDCSLLDTSGCSSMMDTTTEASTDGGGETASSSIEAAMPAGTTLLAAAVTMLASL